jgi:hypothetical protein
MLRSVVCFGEKSTEQEFFDNHIDRSVPMQMNWVLYMVRLELPRVLINLEGVFSNGSGSDHALTIKLDESIETASRGMR